MTGTKNMKIENGNTPKETEPTPEQTQVIHDPNNPKKCVVTKFSILVDGRPDTELDLTGDISKLKDIPLEMKEGTFYRLKISFYIQREPVSGLKHHHVASRYGVNVDNDTHEIGDLEPSAEVQEHITPAEQAPGGMMKRGSYLITTNVTDDAGTDYLTWEWRMDLKREWD